MYYNIKDIETIVGGMKCEFADKFWKSHLIKEYALQSKECFEDSLLELEYFIPIMEFKLLILKNMKTNCNPYLYPQRTEKTDVDTFWNADKILNECDNKILEKFKYYGIQKSILSLYGYPKQTPTEEDCGC